MISLDLATSMLENSGKLLDMWNCYFLKDWLVPSFVEFKCEALTGLISWGPSSVFSTVNLQEILRSAPVVNRVEKLIWGSWLQG